MENLTAQELEMLFNALFEQKDKHDQKGNPINKEREILLRKIFKAQREAETNESR